MKKSLLYYKIDELKEIATKENISLKGLRLKNDIVKKIAKKLHIDPKDEYKHKGKTIVVDNKKTAPLQDLDKLKVSELKDLATKENISLKGLRLKKDIIEKIKTHRGTREVQSNKKEVPKKDDISKLNVIELKVLATKENISLKGLRLKKDIIEKIIKNRKTDKVLPSPDISKLKVQELKEIAKTQNISLKGVASKTDMVRILSKNKKNKNIQLNGPRSFTYFKEIKNKTNKYSRSVLLLGETHGIEKNCWKDKNNNVYQFITDLVQEKKECFDVFVEIPQHKNMKRAPGWGFGSVLSALEKFENSKSPFIRYHEVDYRYSIDEGKFLAISSLSNYGIPTTITRTNVGIYKTKKFLSKMMENQMIDLALGDTEDTSWIVSMIVDLHFHYNHKVLAKNQELYIKNYFQAYMIDYSKILEKRYKKLDGSVEEFKKAYRKASKERYAKSVYNEMFRTGEHIFLNHMTHFMDVIALTRVLTIYDKPVGKQHQCNTYNKNIVLGAGDYHVILYEYFFAFYTRSKPIVSYRNLEESCIEVENPF